MSTAAKALITLLKSEKGKKVIKSILFILLTPLILIIFVIVSLGGGMKEHNHHVIDMLFDEETITLSSSVPEDFKNVIYKLSDFFKQIDNHINALDNVQGRFDDTFIKSIILFDILENEDTSSLDNINVDSYIKIFYDEKLEEVEDEETKELNEVNFIVPIKSTEESLERAEVFFDKDFSSKKEELMEIYHVALTGINKALDEGAPLHTLLEDAYKASEKTPYLGGEFGPLFNESWENYVTSEYGPREPIKLSDGTYTSNFHNGIDFAKPKGTPIYAPTNGTVVLVRYTSSGFGFYAVVDHGGGIFTLYAHMSRIHVEENDILFEGDTIGEVGTTGASTGNHLHFEVIENRARVNPRRYLN